MTAEPYASGLAHLRDELERLDLLLWRHVEAWRERRGGPGEHAGLYVSDEQVDRLLAAGARPSVAAGGSTAEAPRSGPDGRAPCDAPEPGTATDADGAVDRDGPSATGSIDDVLDAHAEAVGARVAATEDADLPLATLAERFDLDRAELDALLVALGPEVDQKYEKVTAYLHDDIARKRPTVGLVLRVVTGSAGGVLGESGGDATRASAATQSGRRSARELLDRRSTLRSARLVHCGDGDAPTLARPVEVDERVLAFLLGDESVAPALDDVATLASTGRVRGGVDADERPDAPADGPGTAGSPATNPTTPAVDADAGVEREAAVARLANDARPAAVAVSGADEPTRRRFADRLARDAGRRRVAADARRIPTDDAGPVLAELCRDARLLDAVLHLYGCPAGEAASGDGAAPDHSDADHPDASAEPRRDRLALDAVLEGLRDHDGDVVLSAAEPVPAGRLVELPAHEPTVVAVEWPDVARRRELWADVDLPAGVDADALAATFRLSAAGVADVVAAARARSDDGSLTAAALERACRERARPELGSLAAPLEPVHDIDDVVLPDAQRRQLEAVVAQVRQRRRVYEEWGFDGTHRGGRGVNVLFTGPPGTGKTMAAEVVGAETGLDVYRVDLASVVSKYVGETERHLRRLFEEGASSDAVLFFDEADALFGERTEVSDAHDRYANVEVDYLLQRMEDHDGVVILATNLESNVDDAFARRIDRSVTFPMPDADARERIWRASLPDSAPAADVDWAVLAGFELSGGEIQNAARTAAFVAADEGGEGDQSGEEAGAGGAADVAGEEPTIEMRHLVRALRRELEKSGRLFSEEDFGEYAELLP